MIQEGKISEDRMLKPERKPNARNLKKTGGELKIPADTGKSRAAASVSKCHTALLPSRFVSSR
jgi:hypothetical protein